jgi:hypothetical protein
MKKPTPVKPRQPEMVAEYASLVIRSGMSNNHLVESLGVRYECILNRKKGKQTVTTEAILALKMVIAQRDANRLLALAPDADPLAGMF